MPPTEGLVDIAGTCASVFASGTRDDGRELHQRGDVAARDPVDKSHDFLKCISRERADVSTKGWDFEPAHEASREGRGLMTWCLSDNVDRGRVCLFLSWCVATMIVVFISKRNVKRSVDEIRSGRSQPFCAIW
jgi:hypothetical protein